MAYARFAGIALLPLALVLDEAQARAAVAQAWPPFVLVGGLLAIGLVAGREGLFAAAAARLELLPGPPVVLLLGSFVLVAVVTALLNLDTAAIFLTPVLVGVARQRGTDVRPFLYGSVYMANASSLFLPGSNLTNLLVLSGHHVSGATFFARMLAVALAAPAVTAAGLIALHRRPLFAARRTARRSAPAVPVPLGSGLLGTIAAAVLILVVSHSALPVLVLGLALVGLAVARGRLAWGETLRWLDVPVLASLFGVVVALGTLARVSAFPGDLLHGAGAPLTAAVAALASVLVNNLPAAVLLSARGQVRADALLVGLNVGPNLAVTGSLAVLLWWRGALSVGIRPSLASYSRQGVLLAPLAIAVALAVAAL